MDHAQPEQAQAPCQWTATCCGVTVKELPAPPPFLRQNRRGVHGVGWHGMHVLRDCKPESGRRHGLERVKCNLRHGMAWHGMAWHGMWHSTAQHGMACCRHSHGNLSRCDHVMTPAQCAWQGYHSQHTHLGGLSGCRPPAMCTSCGVQCLQNRRQVAPPCQLASVRSCCCCSRTGMWGSGAHPPIRASASAQSCM